MYKVCIQCAFKVGFPATATTTTTSLWKRVFKLTQSSNRRIPSHTLCVVYRYQVGSFMFLKYTLPTPQPAYRPHPTMTPFFNTTFIEKDMASATPYNQFSPITTTYTSYTTASSTPASSISSRRPSITSSEKSVSSTCSANNATATARARSWWAGSETAGTSASRGSSKAREKREDF